MDKTFYSKVIYNLLTFEEVPRERGAALIQTLIHSFISEPVSFILSYTLEKMEFSCLLKDNLNKFSVAQSNKECRYIIGFNMNIKLLFYTPKMRARDNPQNRTS